MRKAVASFAVLNCGTLPTAFMLSITSQWVSVGATEPKIWLACPQCNLHKAIKIEAIDPVTEQKVQIFHPRQMKWDDHFRWSNDILYMIGISPTGRATVELLQTNRENLVSLRGALQQLKLHPPD